MKNSYTILAIILIIFAIGFGIYYYNSKTKVSQNENTYNSAKLSTTDNNTTNSENSNNQENTNSTNSSENNANQENTNAPENNANTQENTNSSENNTNTQENINNSENNTNTQENANPSENNTNPQENATAPEAQPQPKETQISEFTTKIYTKEEDRQNNVSITCSTLNDTYVNQGETFSFCNTVGKATTAKGYEKADVFKNGEKVQALGGGNCQVSSTLYNAVLKVPGLDVTERHEHSNTVPYVPKGKDAAVSYRNL